MRIDELLKKSKQIWGQEKLPLSQIIVRIGKVFGDICKWERNDKKNVKTHNNEELKKEFGNLIFSSIKFCDELGYNPAECIELAIKAQKKYVSQK